MAYSFVFFRDRIVLDNDLKQRIKLVVSSNRVCAAKGINHALIRWAADFAFHATPPHS